MRDFPVWLANSTQTTSRPQLVLLGPLVRLVACLDQRGWKHPKEKTPCKIHNNAN
jgi:hypothetical protein